MKYKGEASFIKVVVFECIIVASAIMALCYYLFGRS